MTTSNTHPITAETLRALAPAIREKWRVDHRNVIFALCIKDSIRQKQKPDLIAITTSVIIGEWLDAYLEKDHAATVTIADSLELILSLLRDSVNLAEILP
jgi:hypothetical protein